MIEYIGEHLWAGNLGRAAIIISFTSALLASFSYFIFNKNSTREWLKLGRWSVVVHSISVFFTVAVLFYIMKSHYFEYDYVWKHTSLDLPPKYLFSAFWEGQEGSFLLWMFWHAVLSLVLLFTAKNWESKVVPVITAVQAFLSTMLMGTYIFGTKIGSSPFILIRQLPENVGAPWTEWPDYMVKFPAFFDGNGLNPLLQNYWMTIHPPTLFLGFAAVIIPFAFGMAGLLSKDHKGWIKPAIPWTIFGVTILGTGILMGGAWAYEALSFGGFWAWDPVENSSLVPWLTLVGAMHLLVIERNRGNTLVATYFFVLVSFMLVLYSTFLTRSGALGDTSVHAFVDLGLNGQLLALLLSFIIIPFGVFIYRYKSIPKTKKDDDMSSREFWMFIGSLIFLISALQITFSTSLPIINKFLGPEGVLPLFNDDISLQKPIEHYNSIQVPFAVVITFLMGFTQFLSYRKTAGSIVLKRVLLSLMLALVLSILASIALDFYDTPSLNYPIYVLLLFTGFYAVIANLDYFARLMKGNTRIIGSTISHIGFGLMIIGALISNYKKHIISQNQTFIHKEFPASENLLIEEGIAEQMGPYQVTWKGERKVGNYTYFDLDFLKFNSDSVVSEKFKLAPTILSNEKMGMNSSEPSTKHYLSHDIYTYVSYAEMEEAETEESEWKDKWEFEMAQGEDLVLYESGILKLDSMVYRVEMNESNDDVQRLIMGLHMSLTDLEGNIYNPIPLYYLENSTVSHMDAVVEELGIKIRFEDINTEENKMVINTWQNQEEEKPFIIIQAIVFPWVNVLWLGCILMAIGGFTSTIQRIRKS